MHTTFALSTLGFTALALAAPMPEGDAPLGSWPSSTGAEIVAYIAKFDNIEAGALADLPVDGVTPLGP
jgi:hypothetical protein